jgi:hypothetical protein
LLFGHGDAEDLAFDQEVLFSDDWNEVHLGALLAARMPESNSRPCQMPADPLPAFRMSSWKLLVKAGSETAGARLRRHFESAWKSARLFVFSGGEPGSDLRGRIECSFSYRPLAPCRSSRRRPVFLSLPVLSSSARLTAEHRRPQQGGCPWPTNAPSTVSLRQLWPVAGHPARQEPWTRIPRCRSPAEKFGRFGARPKTRTFLKGVANLEISTDAARLCQCNDRALR